MSDVKKYWFVAYSVYGDGVFLGEGNGVVGLKNIGFFPIKLVTKDLEQEVSKRLEEEHNINPKVSKIGIVIFNFFEVPEATYLEEGGFICVDMTKP